ncbi:ATP-binding protein [Parasutterella secunda]|uniref:ATP-binding protein n=1 Tax=Parasutterella secunda TaxID=626947 RepID=UPI001F874DB6|nr:ATP-binding protein [Parasutterella secunda]MDM8087712.1 ATP-binding protein [Parasutterella secunda]HIR21168.1 ATP-binding protein [Candidatus Aphodousia faecalis]
MISREHYLQQIRPFYESNLVKIVTGIRRCGKSVIMDQIETELRQSGKKTLMLNFEDRSVSALITTVDELIDYISQYLGKEKLYVFLDEVQMIEQWNVACRTLRLKNVSLFITGSNSKLLSKEFTKELSGRYVAFRVRPFVFLEIQEYVKELQHDYSISDYLVFGGFPQAIEFPTKQARLRYLNDLDDTIVINDILNRYKIRKDNLFRRLVNYIMISNARIFSANSVQKFLKEQGFECSLNTILKYLSYLEEAYVISPIRQYSTKAKRELKYYQKLYVEDVSFNSIRQTDGHWDITHNLENIVYNELLYRGFNLFVFREGSQGVDFLAEKNNRQYLIQVAYSIAEESTYRREFALFNKLDQTREKIIITNDDFDFSTSTVRHINLKEFLINESF